MERKYQLLHQWAITLWLPWSKNSFRIWNAEATCNVLAMLYNRAIPQAVLVVCGTKIAKVAIPSKFDRCVPRPPVHAQTQTRAHLCVRTLMPKSAFPIEEGFLKRETLTTPSSSPFRKRRWLGSIWHLASIVLSIDDLRSKRVLAVTLADIANKELST